ncbi:MAG TPA: chemotaxis protein CheW [Usitatibacter sp.]|nr:chemotaxis protein CheW [Usitatibacter sp.]
MSADPNAQRDEFLSFRLASEEYALDILQVREIRACEQVTRIPDAPAFVKGVINLRGLIVPIVDLRLKFGHPAAFGAGTVMIILNIAERLVGIVVDAVSDVVALLPSQIRPTPEMGTTVDVSFIRGLAPLEGRMLIVVDIARLLANEELALPEEALS